MEQQILIEASKIIIPAVVGFAVASIKRIRSYRSDMYRLLEENGNDISRLLAVQEQWGRQFRVLFVVQNKQIKAQRATLEVVARKEANGNVETAFVALNEAEQEIQDYSGDGWGCPPA